MSFLIKLQVLAHNGVFLKLAALLKRGSVLAQVFSCEFCEIYKNISERLPLNFVKVTEKHSGQSFGENVCILSAFKQWNEIFL